MHTSSRLDYCTPHVSVDHCFLSHLTSESLRQPGPGTLSRVVAIVYRKLEGRGKAKGVGGREVRRGGDSGQ